MVKIGSTGHGPAGVLPTPLAPRSTPFCHPWMRLVSALAAASIDREGVSAKWPPVQVKSRVALSRLCNQRLGRGGGHVRPRFIQGGCDNELLYLPKRDGHVTGLYLVEVVAETAGRS